MKNPLKRRARLALSLSNRIERLETVAEKRAKRNGDTLPAGMYLSRTEARALGRLHSRENALVAEMSRDAGARALPCRVKLLRQRVAPGLTVRCPAPGYSWADWHEAGEANDKAANRRRNKRARIAAHMRRLPPHSGRPTRHDLRRIRRAGGARCA